MTLERVRAGLSEILEMLEHYCLQPYRNGVELDAAGKAELTRMANSYGQNANVYARLVEVGELEDRLGEVASRGEQVEHKIEELEREVRESRIEA